MCVCVYKYQIKKTDFAASLKVFKMCNSNISSDMWGTSCSC